MGSINTITTVDSDSINTVYSALAVVAPTPFELDQESYDAPTGIPVSSPPVAITSGVLISSLTNVTVAIPDVDIFTYYDSGLLPNILSLLIGDQSGILNGTTYVEGDLVATYRASGVNLTIDSDGNLTIDSEDAANYSLDALTGSLIYTD